MSTIRVTNLQNASAASPAIVLDANSRATLNGLSYPTEGSLSGRNRIINGDMRIDQRNAGSEINPAADDTYYLDRWKVVSGAASKFKIGRNAGSVTPPAKFSNYLGCTSLSAYSVGSTETFNVTQIIEGFNFADIAWGTASAVTVTLSFWVYSSLTGTFGGSLRNSAVDRSYPFSYTISAANTWELKTITVAGDTAGTWVGATNGNGVLLGFSLGSGSSRVTTAGAWAAGNYTGATGQTNVVGTNGATFYITGVQLEAGSVATPFERRSYGQELALCQRYCEVVQAAEDAQRFALSGNGTTTIFPTYFFKVTKRAAPTLTVSAAGDFKKESYASNTAAASSVGSNRANVDSLTFSVATANTDAGGNLLANNANAKVTFSSEL